MIVPPLVVLLALRLGGGLFGLGGLFGGGALGLLWLGQLGLGLALLGVAALLAGGLPVGGLGLFDPLGLVGPGSLLGQVGGLGAPAARISGRLFFSF